MNIQLITMWYNEEFLAPFFLNHYSWVDKIHIILDADTNDRTEEIAREYPNVEIEHFKFPDMMDDLLKVSKFNDKYRELEGADYVILVDSDEFIFNWDLKKSVRSHLESTGKDIYFVNLWQVFKHENDPPLNPNASIARQRPHGDPDMNTTLNILYVKPCIVKAGKQLFWTAGNHQVVYQGHRLMWQHRDLDLMRSLNVTTSQDEMLQGAHWRLVDLDETIKRRITNRKNRQSRSNLERGLTAHYHEITEQDIIDEYEQNKSFPVVIESQVPTPGAPGPYAPPTPAPWGAGDFAAQAACPAPGGCAPSDAAGCGAPPEAPAAPSRSLDLGCGAAPRNPFYAGEVVGIDARANPAAGVVAANLLLDPIPFPGESFDFVSAHGYLARVPRLLATPELRYPFVEIMNEVYRVLKTGGFFLSLTPAYPHAAAFGDPAGVNIITEETFPRYFDRENRWAARDGFQGAFQVRLQEWRGDQLLTVLQKLPSPAGACC